MANANNRDQTYEELCRAADKEYSSENYQVAEQLYAKALECNPACIEALIGRASLHIKLEEFAKAQEDADRAIDIARRVKCESTTLVASAFLKGGLACFHRGQYQEAKNYFKEGTKYDSSPKTGLNQWIIWCDEKMAKVAKSPKVIEAKKKDEQEKKAQPAAAKKAEQPEVVKPVVAEEANKVPLIPPAEKKIKHDWYQTETTVVVEVRIKGLSKDQVYVEFEPRELSVSATIPDRNNADYTLDIDLAHEIQPEKCTFKILPSKLEIKMLKKDGIRWTVLEGHDPLPVPLNITHPVKDASAKPPSYPGSSKKDWNKIEKEMEKELESEKPEGEAALNEMFAKIYREGDDNLRRAMNKSFQESGGTVLSTNWDEIKKEKTEVKPPDGMEYKKWDE